MKERIEDTYGDSLGRIILVDVQKIEEAQVREERSAEEGSRQCLGRGRVHRGESVEEAQILRGRF